MRHFTLNAYKCTKQFARRRQVFQYLSLARHLVSGFEKLVNYGGEDAVVYCRL